MENHENKPKSEKANRRAGKAAHPTRIDTQEEYKGQQRSTETTRLVLSFISLDLSPFVAAAPSDERVLL